MKVIGIDPGNTESAIAYFDGEKFNFGKAGNMELFHLLRGMLMYSPDAVFIEGMRTMGMPVGATVFETAYFIGEVKMWMKMNAPLVPFNMIFRGDVKMHHCNSMKAKDGNIRQALIDRFGEPGKKNSPGLLYGCKADMWSAVAIAVMGYDRLTQQQR